MDSASIQAQIRANSLEVSDFLSDLNRWEKTIASKDKSIASKRDAARGARANVRECACGMPLLVYCHTVDPSPLLPPSPTLVS